MVEVKGEVVPEVVVPLTEEIERGQPNMTIMEQLTAEPIMIEGLDDPLERRGTQMVTNK